MPYILAIELDVNESNGSLKLIVAYALQQSFKALLLTIIGIMCSEKLFREK
ncbi:MAG: hypothetical protein RM347_016405 [Nostoc sp. ChiQUE02]|uniref:hypothetical protein n=1 Tax=Nostoc sp. ChiQUE02 TaxID=3075377 RepID=UPI003D160E44